ncbi:MAG: YlmH/Sll1252 family protein [Eubacterium sp.]
MDDKELLKSRMEDLSQRAFNRNYTTYSEFLNIEEISLLKSLRLPTNYILFGGYDNAERCVAGFACDSAEGFPVDCIEISPVNEKFADKLSHRDFLGSLMNLGINRNLLGDIAIKDSTGYLFCLSNISQYIIDNLSRIKHTSVKCSIYDGTPDFVNQLPQSEEIIVSSLRADAVTASVYNLSRKSTGELFSLGKVFINSRQTYKDSVLLKNGDVVSVRGYGRFIFEEQIRETKKHRYIVSVRIYR